MSQPSPSASRANRPSRLAEGGGGGGNTAVTAGTRRRTSPAHPLVATRRAASVVGGDRSGLGLGSSADAAAAATNNRRRVVMGRRRRISIGAKRGRGFPASCRIRSLSHHTALVSTPSQAVLRLSINQSGQLGSPIFHRQGPVYRDFTFSPTPQHPGARLRPAHPPLRALGPRSTVLALADLGSSWKVSSFGVRHNYRALDIRRQAIYLETRPDAGPSTFIHIITGSRK